MAPSSGYILVPKAVKAVRLAVSKTAAVLRAQFLGSPARGVAEAIPLRLPRQPLHPLAALKQARAGRRSFTTVAHRLVRTLPRLPAANGSASRIQAKVARGPSSPFASHLRPSLTGGALPRSAGGYSLGGHGVRHFSHVPAAQAQVVQNVSAAMRAFCLQGYQARFDGTNPHTGAARFVTVTAMQTKALDAMANVRASSAAPGTTLEFRITPTMMSLSPLAADQATLETETVVPGLASDFYRTLPHLARVYGDLQKLATLGALPISQSDPASIQVRFAGCDGQTVQALCDELGIQEGIVREDAAWTDPASRDVEMALLFPYADSHSPSVASDAAEYFTKRPIHVEPAGLQWHSMLSSSEVAGPTSQLTSSSPIDTIHAEEMSSSSSALKASNHHEPLWPQSTSGEEFDESDVESPVSLADHTGLGSHSASDYEGIEGIYRFLAECNAAAR